MTVTLSLFAGAGAQFFDNNGTILSGGKIYTYLAGTTTPLAVYTTNSQNAFHTNPIILDSAGRVPSGGEIWLQLGIGYKFVLKTSTDVLIATYDNIPSSAQPPAANDADSIMYEQGYTVSAGSFVVGKIYRIAFVGTTNFTLIGATNNTIGTHFIATGVGTGTGTAELSQTVETKLRQFPSVQDFGAIGDGVADDTAAVQAFFDYIAANNVGTAYCNGKFLISSGVYYGDGVTSVATVRIEGYANFIAANAIDTLVDFRSSAGLIWDGAVTATGIGGLSYASRTCRVGIRVGGSSLTASSARAKFGTLIANAFYDTGLSVETFTTLTDFGNVRAGRCGSGKTGLSLTSNWSNPVNSGSSNSIIQRTVIDVTTLPPESIETPIIVNISGQPYYVYSVDRVNSKLTVFPWVDLTLASGSLIYMFGGGVHVKGSDAGICGFNQIDSINCGFGLWTTALYGVIVNRIVSQNCGAGFAYGREPTASNVGFTLNGYYAENNDFDLLKVTLSFEGGGNNIHGGVIITDYENNYAKWASCAAPRDSGNELSEPGLSSNQVIVISAGMSHEFLTSGNNQQETSSTYSLFSTTTPTHKIFRRDSWTINVQTPDDNLNRLFGYGFDTLTIISAVNTNGNPTGTFTFNAPAGYTVNGGASVAFSGFTGPAVFQIYYQVSTLDILIRCSTYAPSGSATYNPPSLNDGDGATTTVTVTGAELGDYAEASFSNSLQGIMMTAFVSAADTVSVRFQNETGGVLDLASGTLRARVRKAV